MAVGKVQDNQDSELRCQNQMVMEETLDAALVRPFGTDGKPAP